jgi:hypothetical protein
MFVGMLLMAGQTAGPFGPKLSEVTAGTSGMVLGKKKPVERGSPLGWPAGGSQLGLAAVSVLHSLS